MTPLRTLILEKLNQHGECRTQRLAELVHIPRNNLGVPLRAMRLQGYVTSRPDMTAKKVSSNQPHIWKATDKNPDDVVKIEIPLVDIPFGQGNREMNVMATMPLVKLG